MSEATTQSENNTNGIKIPVLEREELILNKRSYNWITERICGVVENRQPFLWWILFIPSAIIALVGVVGGLLTWFPRVWEFGVTLTVSCGDGLL